MRVLKHNMIIRLITFIVALQILNMSIDAPGAEMSSHATPDSYNYIDTYIEYVAEVILKYENAVPESGNRQQREWQQHKQIEIVFQGIEIPHTAPVCKSISENNWCNYSDNYTYQFIKKINPPPKFS